MSDVDTGNEVAIQGTEPVTVPDPVADAVAQYNPPGQPVYPEDDVVRAALSGRPAGNAEEVPEGTDEVRAAMSEAAAPVEPEQQALGKGGEDVE